MNDQERIEALRETYKDMSQERREEIMLIQVARGDNLAIRVLAEFGTIIASDDDAKEYARRRDLANLPIVQLHKRAGNPYFQNLPEY
jgi:hypothetical protein